MDYFAGIDIGGTNVKCSLTGKEGKIIWRRVFSTRPENCEDLAKRISNALSEGEIENSVKYSAIGVSCVGIIDGERGVVVKSVNLGWENQPLGKYLFKFTGRRIYLANDAAMAALAEYGHGGGEGSERMLFLTLGTGIGGVLVSGGKVEADELGHKIKIGNKRCLCKQRGCLEVYASASALKASALKERGKDKKSILWNYQSDALRSEDILECAAAGDCRAKAAAVKYINYLAKGLVKAAEDFKPDVIIIGGGLSALQEALINPLKEEYVRVYKAIGSKIGKMPEIKSAVIGNDAGMIGAAEYAAEEEKNGAKKGSFDIYT